MSELFHTEDCGLSLLCRCRRGAARESAFRSGNPLRRVQGLDRHGVTVRFERRGSRKTVKAVWRSMLGSLRWRTDLAKTGRRSGEKQRTQVIGILGGMSWQSSAEYYRLINEAVQGQSALVRPIEVVLYSLDFRAVARLESEERWDDLAEVLTGAARRSETAGADFLLIASNTAHHAADAVAAAIDIPLVHIADVAAREMSKARIDTAGLLGTRFVMEQEFYKARLGARGLKIIVPDDSARNEIHRIIYEELAYGRVLQASKQFVLETIAALQQQGAQAVLMANTELPLLVRSADSSVMLLDSMALHVKEALARVLPRAERTTG